MQPLVGGGGGTYAHICWSHGDLISYQSTETSLLCQIGPVEIPVTDQRKNDFPAVRTSTVRANPPKVPTYGLHILPNHLSQAGKCKKFSLCVRIVQINSPILFIKRISNQSTL